MRNFVTPVNVFDSELNCTADGAKILTNLTWFPYGPNLPLAGKLIILAKIFLDFK
jgi:hypothetical protein